MNIKNLTKQLVGLSLDEAQLMYKDYDIRVMSMDEQQLIGTCDWVPTRINVAIEKKIITAILNFG